MRRGMIGSGSTSTGSLTLSLSFVFWFLDDTVSCPILEQAVTTTAGSLEERDRDRGLQEEATEEFSELSNVVGREAFAAFFFLRR